MPNYLIIINQQSGTASETNLPEFKQSLIETFAQQDIQAEVKLVDPELLDETIQQGIANRPDAIIVGGGDGTVNSAADMIEGSNIPFGFLPMGTFNLAARDNKIPLDLMEAAEVLAKSQPQSSPLLRVAGRSCLCVTLLGYYPKILKQMESYHGKQWWKKTIKIAKLTLTNFAKSPPRYKTICKQSKVEIRKTSYMISIVPGAYRDKLGIIPEITPVVQGEREKATIYFFQHKSRFKMIMGMFSYLFGEFKLDSDLTSLTFTKAQLVFQNCRELDAMQDGEALVLKSPIDLEFRENALQILKP